MAEYIERETFLKNIEDRYCLPCKEAGKDHNGCKCDVCWVDDMRGDVIDAPTADVEPKRGPATWVRYSTSMMACSRCGGHTARHRFEYCPRCGAPMRERKEE